MHDRSAASAHARRPATVSIDVVLCAPRRRHLSVLLTRPRERDRWALPHAAYIPGESPKNTAAQIARRALDGQPVCLEQFGVFADGRNRSAAYLSIGFVGATCERLGGSTVRAAWFSFRDLPPMQERHVLMINAAMAALRDRMDFTPIAFGLVPTSFTLGALQSAYELLLDQPLHKASFRRALNAAGLVKPTARWHTEGRGRPAQLFTYAPRRRSRAQRRVRFDLLGAV